MATYSRTIVGSTVRVAVSGTLVFSAAGFGSWSSDTYTIDYPAGPDFYNNDGLTSGETQVGGGEFPNLTGQEVYIVENGWEWRADPQYLAEPPAIVVARLSPDGTTGDYTATFGNPARHTASGWYTVFISSSSFPLPHDSTAGMARDVWGIKWYTTDGTPTPYYSHGTPAKVRTPDGQELYDLGNVTETSPFTLYASSDLDPRFFDGVAVDNHTIRLVVQGGYNGDPGTLADGATIAYTGEFLIIPFCDVYIDSTLTGGGGGTVYGLAVDRTPFQATRMVYNAGFNTDTLIYRASNDLEASFTDVTLPFTGQSPDILCLDDHTHLVATTNGTTISVRRIDDTGNVEETMPSPGDGGPCAVYMSRTDPASPVWVAFCDASTDTGNIKVYRTFDAAGLTGWESAVTVVSDVPAQKPAILGDVADLQVWYYDGAGAIQGKHSTDCGATWGDV